MFQSPPRYASFGKRRVDRFSLCGKSLVVLIDEAQNLNESVLETVRILSSFETVSKKLIHNYLGWTTGISGKARSFRSCCSFASGFPSLGN